MPAPFSYLHIRKMTMRKYHDSMTGQLLKVQGLYMAKNRATYSQEVAEGPQAVREALSWAGERVRDIYVTEDVLERYPEFESLTDGHWTHVVPENVLGQVSGDAQGILAVLNSAPNPDIDSLFDNTDLVLLGVEMQDPGNAGTVIRTADAAGAGAVLFGTGSVDHGSAKVIRSAAGSTYHLPILGNLDPRSVIATAKKHGFQVLATDGDGDVILGSNEVDLTVPTLWILGNEARGLQGEILDRADVTVSIPIPGKAESLNVATAAAVCLYASVLARQA